MDAMMIYGPFRFCLETLAYQELSRSTSFSWAEVEHVGSSPGLQYTGKAADTISLPGVFYPHWKGGLAQLPLMRLAGEQGLPLPLITGYGFFLGLWVIDSIEETQTVFFRDGAPRKVDFVLKLKQYASTTDMIKTAVSAVNRLFS